MKKYSSITKGSFRRTSPTKKRIGTLAIVGVICVILFWLVPQVLAGLASFVSVPIQASKTWLAQSSSNLPHYFRDRKVLIQENSY